MIGIELRNGTFAVSFCPMLLSSPAMANDCPSRSSTSVDARRVMSAGIRKPDSVMPLLKSSALTSGLTFNRITISGDGRRERKPDSEFLELDRHGAGIALDDRDREFPAGEEAGLLAVVGDQVRLGQTPKRPLFF